jgi:hypothetical protein
MVILMSYWDIGSESGNTDEFLDFLGMQRFVYRKECGFVTEVKTGTYSGIICIYIICTDE